MPDTTLEMTAEQHRQAAITAGQAAADSFDRCDTDGALSQWGNGMTARLHRLAAEIADDDGTAVFPALFDLDGNLVAAKLVPTRYGMAWGLLASDNPFDEIVRWVTAFPTRTSTMERKGYREGTVRARARADYVAPAGARGLGGAMSVTVVAKRCDGGFSRDAVVVDDGRSI